MKRVRSRVMIALLFFLPAFVMAGGGDEGNSEGNQTKENLFVFRAQKKLIGAKVEIFSSDGELLTAQTMQKRKMIIDFAGTNYGTYTIKLTKGDMVKEFRYVKK